MARYVIIANGTDMGTYEGDDAAAAILEYVKDSGYESVAKAANALEQTEDEFLADIKVQEVSPMSAAKDEVEALDFVVEASERGDRLHVTVIPETTAREVAEMAEHCGLQVAHIEGDDTSENIVVVLAERE